MSDPRSVLFPLSRPTLSQADPAPVGWDASPATPEPDPASDGPAPAELAATLAARMCHDFISPASAIVSGVDLLEDPSAADMREDALNLIGASARKLVAMLAFARVAFGASAAAETYDARDLRKLVDGVFAHVRADLDWAVEAPSLNKASARALLNMAQIAAGALPTGGIARLTSSEADGVVLLAAEATSPRARLKPEVEAGLKGRLLAEGLAGHWVQAYYLHALLAAAGGSVDAHGEEGRVVLRARVPAT